VTDTTVGTLNETSPKSEDLVSQAYFSLGTVRGGAAFTHRSDELTWTVQAAGFSASSATTGLQTRTCQAVIPLASCQTFKSLERTILIGYRNPNSFPIYLPKGVLNQLSDGVSTQEQPTEFLPGLNLTAARVTVPSSKRPNTWIVNGVTLSLDAALQACAAQCVEIDTTVSVSSLNKVTRQLSELAQRATHAVFAGTHRNSIGADRRGSSKVARTLKLVKGVEFKAYRLTAEIPMVARSCSSEGQLCAMVDHGETINTLRKLHARLVTITKRQAARCTKELRKRSKRLASSPRRAQQLQQRAIAEMDNLPRSTSTC
jgi:hypothetical protein